jgi:outer membrane cobalamin receptor
MYNKLEKFILKTIIDNYESDYNAFDTTDVDFHSEFPLNLFIDNQEFIKKLKEAQFDINFDKQMINRIFRYYKKNNFDDYEVKDAIRTGNLTQLSVLYACSIANKLCRKIQLKEIN